MYLIKSSLAAVGSVFVLFALAKLLGNKQISQLNMFDYINGITIGSIAAEMSISTSFREISIAFVSMMIYGIAGFLLSVITIKSIVCRRFFSGKALMLIEKGKLYEKNLKKAKLDIDDLLTKARVNGHFDLSRIEYAILENNGEISFLQKAQDLPLTPADAGINVSPSSIFVNVVMDGKIMEKNLSLCGKDDQWLTKKLAENKYSVKDVFLATVDDSGTLNVFPYQLEENKKNYFS